MAVNLARDGGASLTGEAKAALVQRMFDRIVPRYDLMNRLMTGGMDLRWRALAVKAAEPKGKRALDVATGTGDLAAALCEAGADSVVGADFALNMLRAARGKLTDAISLVQGDAQCLPFADATFDRVTNAFLLRNLADLDEGLREMRRVLRPGGRLVCLEITRPQPGLFAALFHLYFYKIVPEVGGLLTGQRAAYRYLPNSLSTFPRAADLAVHLRAAGFVNISYRLLSLGTVALHVAETPAA